jgi:hypothetical protein
MKIVKYIFSTLFIIGGIGMISQNSILSGLSSIVLGILVFPLLSEKLKEIIKLWNNKAIRYSSYALLFILLGATSKELRETSINATKKEVKRQTFKVYSDKVTANVNSLSKDRKLSRQNIIDKLQATETYKNLVVNKKVTAEYLPLMTAINNGLRLIAKKNKDKYETFSLDKSLSDNIENSINGKDKLDFAINVMVLATPNKGGYTKELLEMFVRYRKKFGMYGMPNKMYSVDEGTEENIEIPYNMTSIFYHIEPNNKAFNAIYESNKKGAGKWFGYTKGQDFIYEYLATKKGYLAYAKKVNPNSPYILKVDYEVTATKLFRDYQDNEVAADDIYKGKKLAVTGIIDDIGNDALNDSYITLKTGYVIGSVQCYLDKKIVAKLKKGQKVVVTGRCKGLFVNVSLKDCKIF